MNECCILTNTFTESIQIIMLFFIYFVNMVNYMGWFLIVKPTFYSLDKSLLVSF